MQTTRTFSRLRRGFTVLELLVALTIITLLTLGTASLYVTAMRTGATVLNQSATSQDAALSVVTIETALREARRFDLMDGGAYGNTYLATDAGGNVVAVTGIHIVFPGKQAVTVVTNGAGNTTTFSGNGGVFNNNFDGAYLDIYRSDAAGNPAPRNGSWLWMRGTLNGGALPEGGQPLCNDIASWDGAVQFIQPMVPGTSTPLKNQVRMKLTTGLWDRVQHEVTSDSTRGVVTSLTGEHVYLRNHDPNGTYSGGVHGQTQYSGD